MSKRVLITGAAGFIGSHALRYFVEKYPTWSFVVLDRLNYAAAPARIADLMSPSVQIVLHDLRSAVTDHARKQIGDVDLVMHFAAETHVDRSLVEPQVFVETNVLGTFHLLEFCRRYQPRLQMFFMVSTDESFGPAEVGVDHREDFPHRPSNVYAATKAGAEDLAYAYNHSMGVPVIITNTMNNIASAQHAEKYVPRIIKALLHGNVITVHGTPDNIGSRKYLHARDHADAINFLLSNGKRGERYNVVGTEEVSNLDLVKRIEYVLREDHGKTVEAKVIFQDFHLGRPGHDRRYSLDGGKMASLGWTPPTDLAATLREIVAWTLTHTDWI